MKIILTVISFILLPWASYGQANSIQPNKAIKITPVSYFFNTFNLSYEYSYMPQRAFEFTLGVIGVSDHNTEVKPFWPYLKRRGALGRFGWKNTFRRGLNINHQILGGTYIKYETGVSLYEHHYYEVREDNNGNLVKYDESINSIFALNFMIGLGQQLVLGKRWVINGYAAVGPNFSNFNSLGIYDEWRVAPYNSGVYPDTDSRFSTLLVFNLGYAFK